MHVNMAIEVKYSLLPPFYDSPAIWAVYCETLVDKPKSSEWARASEERNCDS